MPSNGENEKQELIGFIVKALREHEQEIDELVLRLEDAKNKQSNLNQSLYGKASHIEEKLAQLKVNLDTIKTIAYAPSEALSSIQDPSPVLNGEANQNSHDSWAHAVMHCVQWEDFQNLAVEPDWVTFLLNDTEKSFQVEALKEGRLMIYRGGTPVEVDLLKSWLVHELEVVNERTVLSGTIKLSRGN
jgi:hypothetical protein